MTLTARIKEYKSSVASFLYLINSAVTMAIYVGIAVYYTIQEQRVVEIANLADFVYLANCMFDALVYTLWFKKARLDVLKIFSKMCVRLQPSVERMRLEVFSIITYQPEEINNI